LDSAPFSALRAPIRIDQLAAFRYAIPLAVNIVSAGRLKTAYCLMLAAIVKAASA